MPSRLITVVDAMEYIAETSFRSGPIERVGVELEWLAHDVNDPSRAVSMELVRRVLDECADLPAGSQLTCEPGGQVELSSRPGIGLAGCLADTSVDLDVLRRAADQHGVGLVGTGLDPVRPSRPAMSSPRYQAMATYFAPYAPASAMMMYSSASVQVCLDAGPADPTQRWRAANAIGPVLIGAFANSPLYRGRPTGWRSTRWAAWDQLDPSRTRPVVVPDGGNVREAYAAYCLDAGVMCIRTEAGPWITPEYLTLREWVASSGERPVTLGDIDFHLSTLFPPVRARGYLELRMIDAQPDDGWRLALAVASVLLDVPAATEAALAATEELHATTGDPWILAARDGLSHPVVARAARACFAAVESALEPGPLHKEITQFQENYVERGRCPADNVL